MRLIEWTGIEAPLPDVAGRGEAGVPVGGVTSVSVAEGVVMVAPAFGVVGRVKGTGTMSGPPRPFTNHVS
jgi:hypothetical protein